MSPTKQEEACLMAQLTISKILEELGPNEALAVITAVSVAAVNYYGYSSFNEGVRAMVKAMVAVQMHTPDLSFYDLVDEAVQALDLGVVA